MSMDHPFAARWYDARITETIPSDTPEPDWSKVPEAKRAMVRERWHAAQYTESVTVTKLWGPQIAFFRRQYPGVDVAICDREPCTAPCLWNELWCPRCQWFMYGRYDDLKTVVKALTGWLEKPVIRDWLYGTNLRLDMRPIDLIDRRDPGDVQSILDAIDAEKAGAFV